MTGFLINVQVFSRRYIRREAQQEHSRPRHNLYLEKPVICIKHFTCTSKHLLNSQVLINKTNWHFYVCHINMILFTIQEINRWYKQEHFTHDHNRNLGLLQINSSANGLITFTDNCYWFMANYYYTVALTVIEVRFIRR